MAYEREKKLRAVIVTPLAWVGMAVFAVMLPFILAGSFVHTWLAYGPERAHANLDGDLRELGLRK